MTDRAGALVPDGLIWLEQYVAGLRRQVLDLEFYHRLPEMRSPSDFTWARHLLHHSYEFPAVLRLRGERNRVAGHEAFFDDHVEAEAGHYLMLGEWLARHGIADSGAAALALPPTPETVACIAQAYRVACSEYNEIQIVALNVALESASFDFFSKVSPHLDTLGIGDEYWRIHMLLDEFHSADGLALLRPVAENSVEGTRMKESARETLVFWGAMLNSWVGGRGFPDLSAPGQEASAPLVQHLSMPELV